MNKPVNFEIAKLLAEKGFDERCRFVHDTWNNIHDWVEDGEGEHRNSHKNASIYYSAPTIADVVIWLYEKHGIWASVYTMDKWLPNGNDREQLFDYSLKQMKLGLIDIPKKPEEFNSPTEAYEAAIKYVLSNIK